jgi:hypothetical protein
MRGGLSDATGVIHCCGQFTLIYLYSHSNTVRCTWIPLQNHFSCSSLRGIIATPEIQTSSVQPEKNGVLERNILFAFHLCDKHCSHTSNVHLIREIPDERDEKCFNEWCCQLQRLYSVRGMRNQTKEWSTGGIIPMWENWITRRKICSSAIPSATISTGTGLRSKHKPLQLETGD